MKKRSTAYLSLGTNIGEKEENLIEAIKQLGKVKGIRIEKISGIYTTEPIGYKNQDYFLNCAVKVRTHLKPYELLRVVNEIEENMKRKRIFKWGPRIIDIDIIFWGQLVIKRDDLIIPHKEYSRRNFVMIPILEICKDGMRSTILSSIKKGTGDIYKWHSDKY